MISQYNYSTSKQPKVHIYTGYIDVIHASLITFRIFFQSNNTCTHLTFLAIEVVVLAEENLMTMESITLPDVNSPACYQKYVSNVSNTKCCSFEPDGKRRYH